MVSLTFAGLLPILLLLTTSFVRLSIVLALVRHALGSTQLLSNQVLTALALVLTCAIMTPCWRRAYEEGVRPYLDHQPQFTLTDAWDRGSQPIREFVAAQLQSANGAADVRLFWEYTQPNQAVPSSYEAIPLTTLLPAFLLSELRTAFFIGFRI
ncbi:MAG TPA: flagellar type III secretion system pore protein FliP, partial [Pirellulaceae bacterium]